MTPPSDDETTSRQDPLPKPPSDQNNLARVGRSSTYWLFAAACIIFTIGVLALVSKGVRENNYHFDATNLTTTGQSERIAARANHDAILAVGYRCAGQTNKSAHTVKVADYLLTMAADTDLKRGTSGSGPPMLLEAPNY